MEDWGLSEGLLRFLQQLTHFYVPPLRPMSAVSKSLLVIQGYPT